jgi:adenosylcobinamide kinase/adenosylcobinamide-phosphate guanylyltransferase
LADRILFIGGARSGKSRNALNLAESYGHDNNLFLATCVASDAEMKQRVARHQQERGARWTTHEIPVAIPEAIDEYNATAGVILLDCLTLWLSNLLMETDDPVIILEHVPRLMTSLENASCPVILVTNEVGTGIVPENRIARIFRDTAGYLNQQAATCCNQVFHVVAGIAISIKSPGTQ